LNCIVIIQVEKSYITRSLSEEAGTQFSESCAMISYRTRLGRTEYQLLLMKISWWDRNVKIWY